MKNEKVIFTKIHALFVFDFEIEPDVPGQDESCQKVLGLSDGPDPFCHSL